MRNVSQCARARPIVVPQDDRNQLPASWSVDFPVLVFAYRDRRQFSEEHDRDVERHGCAVSPNSPTLFGLAVERLLFRGQVLHACRLPARA